MRTRLVAALGRAFSPVYSVLVLAAFAGMLLAFRASPYVEVWTPPRALRWGPLVAMAVAIFLFVCGFSTRSATVVAQGAYAEEEAAARGIFAITRHPANWGFAIWGASHLFANGELRAVIVFVAILSLAIVGMVHIDRRRARDVPDAWRAFAARTSLVPFVALAQGRAKLRFGDIGVARLVAAVVVYVGILHAHALVVGASPLP